MIIAIVTAAAEQNASRITVRLSFMNSAGETVGLSEVVEPLPLLVLLELMLSTVLSEPLELLFPVELPELPELSELPELLEVTEFSALLELLSDEVSEEVELLPSEVLSLVLLEVSEESFAIALVSVVLHCVQVRCSEPSLSAVG